ncbi:MAG: alanine racemase [candidate division Zixibacteria bacterium]|nr:alanine racemase [candidate division Zixibacteria bacterium]
MTITSLSWLEIDAAALRQNIEAIRANLSPGCLMVPVVKANAYGHGYLEIGKLLDKQGFPFLAVHNLEEAILLREGGIENDILIMGYIPLADLRAAVAAGFDLVVYNLESLKKLVAVATAKQPARCHLKLETGTQRQGITEERLPEFLKEFQESSQLMLRGVSSHFANIEDTTDHSYAQLQMERFGRMKDQVIASGFAVPYYHIASSAASLLFPETHFHLARVGIALYGLWPSKETYLSYRLAGKENQILKPVLTWKSLLGQIKDVRRGEYVGYGTTYRATADMKLGVVPIGYFDGYDRLLSNRGYCLVNGRRAPIRGRICMNLFMIDVTDIPDVRLENTVVLIGESGDEIIRAEDLAEWANTINYEIVTRIGAHLKRIVTNP